MCTALPALAAGADDGLRLGQRERALVEGAADDDADDVGRAQLAQPAQVVQQRDAARQHDLQRRDLGELREAGRLGPPQHAVAGRCRCTRRGCTPCSAAARRSAMALICERCCQPCVATMPSRAVDADDEAVAEPVDGRRPAGRAAVTAAVPMTTQCTPMPADTREALRRRGRRRRTARGSASALTMRSTMCEVGELAGARRVEVDDVQRLGALLCPVARQLDRVVAEDGDVVEVAARRRTALPPWMSTAGKTIMTCSPPDAMAATKSASRCQADARALLGVELHCPHVVARHRRDDRPAVVGGGGDDRRVGRDARRTSARSRRRPAPAGRAAMPAPAGRPLELVPADVRHLEAASRSRSTVPANTPEAAASGRPRRCSRRAAAGRGRRRGTACRRRCARARRPPGRLCSSRAAASRKAPTPGSTTAPARAHLAGALRHARVGAGALQRLGHAGEVAHAVVDDGDARGAPVRRRRPSEGALGGRHLVVAPVPLAGLRAAPGRTPLNTASTMWCASLAGEQAHVQRHARLCRQRAEEVRREVAVELADAHARRAAGRARSTAARRDRARPGRAPRPWAAGTSRSGAMPRLSPRASRSACPSARPMSSTVWCPSTSQVAAGAHGEVEAAVVGEQLQHVVEEADAGDARRPCPVPSRHEGQRDVGLGGGALDARRGGVHAAPQWCSVGSRHVVLRQRRAGRARVRAAGPPRRRWPPPAAPARRRRRASSSTTATRFRKASDGEALAEAGGAAGGQHVVGAGGVVGEGSGGVRADEDGAGVAHARRAARARRAVQLEVLGRERVARAPAPRRGPGRRRWPRCA